MKKKLLLMAIVMIALSSCTNAVKPVPKPLTFPPDTENVRCAMDKIGEKYESALKALIDRDCGWSLNDQKDNQYLFGCNDTFNSYVVLTISKCDDGSYIVSELFITTESQELYEWYKNDTTYTDLYGKIYPMEVWRVQKKFTKSGYMHLFKITLK